MSIENTRRAHKPNLLCIVPPYPITVPPAGAAALLGYLKQHGCHDFDFLDMRLWVPQSYATTYSSLGVFGESFVIDIPDLPLVLRLLDAFDKNLPLVAESDERIERYSLERGINPGYIHEYLTRLDSFLEHAINRLGHLELVGFTVWNSNYLSTLMAAAHLKRRRVPPLIVAGGPQVTESQNAAKLGLRSGLFDVIALGEGEDTLLSLYRAFESNTRTLSAPIPGTMCVNSETGEFASSKAALLKIKELPLPSFEKMDIPAYERRGQRFRVLPFQLSRGCTDKCSFCSEWGFWERFRSDDIDRVIGQIEELKAIYNIGGVAFTDSLLNGVMPRLQKFAAGLIERNVNIKWGGFMRANMDSQTASLLRRAGCVLGFFGIESFDDETLIEMNKRRTVADNIAALEAFLNAGIAVRAGFIPGFPSDTRSRFMKTAMIFRALQKRFPDLLSTGIEPFVVAPGQPIYQNLEKYGLTPLKWADEFLDIAPRYRSITETIYCTVEGANQGVERLGQYQIATTMSQDTLNRDRTRQHMASPQSADFMHYSYNPEEIESIFDFTIEHLFGNWYLGTFKTDSALLAGCILSHEEREEYLKIRCQEKVTRPWASTSSLLKRDSMAAFMAGLEREHIVMTPGLSPRICWPKYRRSIQTNDYLRLSSFAIAREWMRDGDSEIILVNTTNKRYHRAANSFKPVLDLIIDTPRSLKEIVDALEDCSEILVPDGIPRLINEMKELGILVVCDQANDSLHQSKAAATAEYR